MKKTDELTGCLGLGTVALLQGGVAIIIVIGIIYGLIGATWKALGPLSILLFLVVGVIIAASIKKVRNKWKREIENETEKVINIKELRNKLLSYLYIYQCVPCSRCNETEFQITELSPSGRSMQVECTCCNKKTRFKAQPGSNTSAVMECYYELKRLGYVGTIFSINYNQTETRKRPSIPSDIKQIVWERDGGRCVECGSIEDLQYDHIIPFSKGGSSTAENLQILCGSCNRSKSDQIQ